MVMLNNLFVWVYPAAGDFHKKRTCQPWVRWPGGLTIALVIKHGKLNVTIEAT